MIRSHDEQRRPPALPAGVDAMCDAFEAAWLAGHEPRIEDSLSRGDPVHQDELLRELLLAEWDLRQCHGQDVELETYRKRFPHSSQLLAQLWHAWQAKPSERSGDGPASGFATALHTPATVELGTVIDRYKLLEELGEGGFGTVWVAEQRQPVKRRVALKVIKLGMDTKQVVARFEAERQALALMDHPNIAKVLDAGSTETGRPYFVMELVRGIPITKYCDQEKLSIKDRLDLFMKVCHAIQHAHQKGIIHRDIKPTNILVTLHDGVPVPKVIDFGVAKAIQQELTEKTIYTQLQQFIGTPAYMSPEQAEMSGLDIDTRSDIYSLGVLLYELLTGATPFDARELMSSGLDAMRKIIREREPITPSSRLSKDHQTRSASADQSLNDLPRSAVDRDLDWIVMKCLEKDRARRYDTANSLAADVKRHLDNEPVAARPPSAAYRLQKAWRRNKLVYTTGVAVFMALVAGLTLAAFGLFQALTQRDAAVLASTREETARKRAQASEERAVQERRKAERATEETRRRAYASEINAAFHALDENNLEHAIDLLDRQRPRRGEEDLRGFEWRLLWQLCQSDERATLGAGAVAFSPDGKRLATAGDRIVICELRTQANAVTIPHAATALAFSPHGNLLASGHDSHVTIWSTESRQVVQSLPDAGDPAAFSPDGKWLVTSTDSGYQVWETATWEEQGPLPGTRFPAVFSPDGRWMVTGAPGLEKDAPGGYLAWNTETWQSGRLFGGELERVWVANNAVAFSPDGTLLVTAGHPDGRESGHQFQVWDFPSLTVHSNFEKFPGRLSCAVFAPDGKHLLTGTGSGVLLVWNVAEGRIVERLNEHAGWMHSIISPRDGRTFATAGGDRTLVLWDAATRKVLARFRGHLGQVRWLAMSPDGRMLASSADDGTTKLWDATKRHKQRELPECLLVAGFSSDSRRLVGVGYRESRLWNLDDGVITTIPLQDYNKLRDRDYLGFMCGSEDVYGVEPQAVYGRTHGLLEVWNLATMSRVTSWRAGDGDVATAAFSPDGQFIATSGEGGDVILWNAVTHREVRRFEALGGPLMCLKFSPDGLLLAGSEDKGAQDSHVGLWDVDTGALRRKLPIGHLVISLAFSPDGKLLATAETNETAQLWEIPSGALRATLMGHVGPVVGVAFSPDGETLATAAEDCKVKLWNIATQQEVATLKLPDGGRSVRFSPDGRTLAAGYLLEPEQYIRLWEVPSFEEIAAAEAGPSAESKQP
jgi:WD40 repeat protein/tRNA A-37 threonylcarbamoyl transferase component Bud32